jgi:hypothetical protein
MIIELLQSNSLPSWCGPEYWITNVSKDDDFHLVIAEPGDRSKTMIAEILARGCSRVCRKAFCASSERPELLLPLRTALKSLWLHQRTIDGGSVKAINFPFGK